MTAALVRRRGILERLGRSDASISDLAAKFEITLTGLKKHVHIVERSGLVTSRKAAWLDRYRQMVDARLDRLGEFLERTKGRS